MKREAFLDHLRTVTADAITSYRKAHPKGRPLTARMVRDRDGPLAGEADVRTCLSALTTVYDDLFDVDSTPYRESWREGLVYDCSRRERLALLTMDLPASLTLVWTKGRYSGQTGVIGVSPTRLPEAEAHATLASELCHAYQHRLGSPTWTHPYSREGFEQAASIRAIDQVAADYDHDTLARLAASQRAEALLTGYIAHATRHGGITTEDVRALGVTEAELDELHAPRPWRLLAHVRPQSRWSGLAIRPEYVLYSSVVLASEAAGVAEPYARAFHGTHPWEAVIEDIRSIRPSWLWRLYDS